MKHRHLNHDELTLAAIDSIIERGAWRDWLRLARAIRHDESIAEKVAKLTSARFNNRHDVELDQELFSRWYVLAVKRKNKNNPFHDPILDLFKRENQEKFRAEVRAGQRTQESAALFSKEIVSQMKIEYRDVDYDE